MGQNRGLGVQIPGLGVPKPRGVKIPGLGVEIPQNRVKSSKMGQNRGLGVKSRSWGQNPQKGVILDILGGKTSSLLLGKNLQACEPRLKQGGVYVYMGHLYPIRMRKKGV